MNDSERLERALFLLRLSSETYKQVNTSRRAIDQKVHNILALTATMTTFFVTIFYYLLSSHDVSSVFRLGYVWFFLVGVLCFVFVIIVGAVAYMPWNLTVFDVDVLIRKYAKRSYLDQVKIAVVNITDATWKNSDALATKSFSYRLMLVGLMCGVLSFFIGFVFLAVPYLWPLC
jgi:hypothetical protein